MSVCVVLGVQNLDTKGVPAVNDEIANAAEAVALGGEGAVGPSGRTQRLTFIPLSTIKVCT